MSTVGSSCRSVVRTSADEAAAAGTASGAADMMCLVRCTCCTTAWWNAAGACLLQTRVLVTNCCLELTIQAYARRLPATTSMQTAGDLSHSADQNFYTAQQQPRVRNVV